MIELNLNILMDSTDFVQYNSAHETWHAACDLFVFEGTFNVALALKERDSRLENVWVKQDNRLIADAADWL